ncbi:hypothetical protein ACOJCM_14220 [Billgrantia sp. LNSP4103-1]|uniref:hypothetical protein n=1 Tax=Billgrantia sp. LNSP4103-1 TaxID=3410266 RepID=UPI00403F117D
MRGQGAFIPGIEQLSATDGWTSVHQLLPLDSRKTLQVVFQDVHGAGVTSASFERGRFLSETNRALVRGVKAWRFMQERER